MQNYPLRGIVTDKKKILLLHPRFQATQSEV